MLNEDYRDMLQALADEKAEFLLVGAYALAAHGYPRATMDIDIWVNPSSYNAEAVLRALKRFGAPLHNLTKAALEADDTVFQIGVAPRRIDIITGASGLEFEAAYARSVEVNIEGIDMHVLSLDDLIRNKRAAGRTRDLADVEALEALKNTEPLRPAGSRRSQWDSESVLCSKEVAMKRSEINALLESAKDFFRKHQFLLPPWAHWKPSDWKGKGETCAEIVENMLGWDITDFGSGDFERCGLLLFTIRNGHPEKGDKTYAEKVMIVRENQETPMHFHWSKMEDIINRGGGNLVIELYQSTDDERFSDKSFAVKIDGISREVQPGGTVVLRPGESICLTQRLYHRFYGEAGKGWVLVGEVSQVNDDRTDNRFHEKIGRFPEIEEDVKPIHLLCSEYAKFL